MGETVGTNLKSLGSQPIERRPIEQRQRLPPFIPQISLARERSRHKQVRLELELLQYRPGMLFEVLVCVIKGDYDGATRQRTPRSTRHAPLRQVHCTITGLNQVAHLPLKISGMKSPLPQSVGTFRSHAVIHQDGQPTVAAAAVRTS